MARFSFSQQLGISVISDAGKVGPEGGKPSQRKNFFATFRQRKLFLFFSLSACSVHPPKEIHFPLVVNEQYCVTKCNITHFLPFFRCKGNYYGNRCEIDGEVIVVAIGASVAAVFIIVLTLICLCMWRCVSLYFYRHEDIYHLNRNDSRSWGFFSTQWRTPLFSPVHE